MKHAWLVVVVFALLVTSVTGATAWVRRDAHEAIPVYFSIGDDTQSDDGVREGESAPELFRDFLADELDTRIRWITSADHRFRNETAGDIDDRQLLVAEKQLDQLRDEGRHVAVITLGIGLHELSELVEACRNGVCPNADDDIENFTKSLDHILMRITRAKDRNTPLFVMLAFNPIDCGQLDPGSSEDRLVIRWNDTLRAASVSYGAFVVDTYEAFRGKACNYTMDSPSQLTPSGSGALVAEYIRVFESLPDQYR